MLQALINRILKLNTAVYPYMEPLNGKNIAIICQDYTSYNLYATIEDNNILFSSYLSQEVDLEITANLMDFVKFAITKDRKLIRIHGDGALATDLEKLYLHMNIDWEEELSKITGDIIAHKAFYWFQTLKKYSSESAGSFAEMIVEYAQNEASILPTQEEVDIFMHDVDELKLRVDRLAARIKAYENN